MTIQERIMWLLQTALKLAPHAGLYIEITIKEKK